MCCALQLCPVAVMAFPGQRAPCPALVLKEQRTVCALVEVEREAGIEPLIARTLGIGAGCSMPDAETTDAEIAAFDQRSREKLLGGAHE